MTQKFSQPQWDALMQAYPPGTAVSGVVKSQAQYGVWITLDDLPTVPALLEVVHLEMIETTPNHNIRFPVDYPAVGAKISARVLAWSSVPKDVRLTQLSHLEWVHKRRS